MSKDYRDILYREHPRSPHRVPMSLRDRAAQFSPFAALSGYEAVLAACARHTESEPELAEDEQALLDEKLRQLALREDGAEIAIRYFCPDERKTGGSILSLQGHFLRLDPQARLLVLQEGSVPIDRLLALENIE